MAKNPGFITPAATLVYPKIHEPSYGTKQYPVELGQFETKIRFSEDNEDFKYLLACLETHMEAAEEAAKEAVANLPVASKKKLQKSNGQDMIVQNPLARPIYDPDTEDETGDMEMKFKRKYKVRRKKDNSIVPLPFNVFDANGQPLKIKCNGAKRGPFVPPIGGGSVAKIAFEVRPFFVTATGLYGLSIDMTAVQIIEARLFGDASASSFGFEKTDGFVAADDEEAPEDEDAPTTEEEDDVPF